MRWLPTPAWMLNTCIKVIDHAECYAKGHVHTNGLENFWSLLKRGIKGTYVSVEPFHLFRYLDEQAFRFNERKDNDAGRFVKVVSGIIGKGLRYAKLIAAREGSDGPNKTPGVADSVTRPTRASCTSIPAPTATGTMC